MRNKKRSPLFYVIMAILIAIYLFFPDSPDNPGIPVTPAPDKDGYYYSYEDVTDYLLEYSSLPPNYITKSEARDLGWESEKGNLWEVADGMVIGGDTFGNREGLLPKGEKYIECDVNYSGGFRGSDRIVFSADDGDMYVTFDHYETFDHIGTFEVIR